MIVQISRRIGPLVLVAVALAVALAAVLGPAHAQAAEPIRLALNWKAEPQFGGFYAAREGGHFAAQGLDVDIIEGGSGAPTIQITGAGQVEYGIVAADELVISHDRGAGNVVALFAVYQTNPQAIMSHRSRGFGSLKDVLQSDGILLWQGGLPYAQFLLRENAPVKVRTAPYLGGIGNFRNDPMLSQQCFYTSEPLSAARVGLEVDTFLIADSGYNPYLTVLVTTRERLASHPEEVRAVVAAVRAGWEAYLADPAPTNRAMGAINKAMDEQTFRESAALQVPLIRPEGLPKLGAMTTERWQTLVQQLQSLKVIRKAIDATTLFVDL